MKKQVFNLYIPSWEYISDVDEEDGYIASTKNGKSIV